MRRFLQRAAAGLLAPLLLVGGVASTGAICPARLGFAAEDPCPCEHEAPGDRDTLARPCCCEEMAPAPASSSPVAGAEAERVQGPEAPILIVGEGLVFVLAAASPRPAAVERPAGAGPPILRRTSALLI